MSKILRLLATTFSAACIIGIFTSLICWVMGWTSVVQFSDGLFTAGAFLVVIGIISVIGGYEMRANFGVIYSQSAGDMNTLERSKLWIADTIQSYSTLILLVLTGLYLIGFAILIPIVL